MLEFWHQKEILFQFTLKERDHFIYNVGKCENLPTIYHLLLHSINDDHKVDIPKDHLIDYTVHKKTQQEVADNIYKEGE